MRVLGRVMLNKHTHRLTGEPAGARGWRSFTSIPVQHARVEVEVGRRHEHHHRRPLGAARRRRRGGPRTRLAPGRVPRGELGAHVRDGLRRRPVGRLRAAVRHRRHGHDDRAPPPAARGVAHLRGQRARAHDHARDAGALRAADRQPPRRPGALPLDRRLERRAHAHPVPVAQPLPRRRPAADRLGPDAGRLVPRRHQAQARHPRPAGPRVPARCAGCWSATTASTTRRRTPGSASGTPTRSWPSASASSPRARRCWRAAAAARTCGRDGSDVPWFYAYDGAGLAEQLEDAGLLRARRSSPRSSPDPGRRRRTRRGPTPRRRPSR